MATAPRKGKGKVRNDRRHACGKTRYPDAQRAKHALRTIRQVGNVDPDGKIPVRWYDCEDCHGYHLTSQE